MSRHYQFSETQVNKDELRRYREDSDSVLSFVRECCALEPGRETGSTELFNAYRAYCEDCGLKPYSQRGFVQNLTVAYPEIVRDTDKMRKSRTLKGIHLDDALR